MRRLLNQYSLVIGVVGLAVIAVALSLLYAQGLVRWGIVSGTVLVVAVLYVSALLRPGAAPGVAGLRDALSSETPTLVELYSSL